MKNLFNLLVLLILISPLSSCSQEKNKIIGIWHVKTNFYEGIYEIISSENKYFGKVIEYKDSEISYKGDDKKEDYFLIDAVYKGGKYIEGRMYTFDQKYYNVIITMLNNNALEVAMMVDGNPYKEKWNRVLPH